MIQFPNVIINKTQEKMWGQKQIIQFEKGEIPLKDKIKGKG